MCESLNFDRVFKYMHGFQSFLNLAHAHISYLRPVALYEERELRRDTFAVPAQLFSVLGRPFLNDVSVFSNQASANCSASSPPVSKLTTTKPEPDRLVATS